MATDIREMMMGEGGVMLIKSELKPLAPPRQKLAIDPSLAAAAGGVVGVAVAVATHLVSQRIYERHAALKRKRKGATQFHDEYQGFEIQTVEKVVVTRVKFKGISKDKLSE
jgi:hypothetical protein